MSLTELVIAALAVWQILEIWHHSLICARPRATVELWCDFLADLFACPFCLSPWVSALVCGALVCGPQIIQALGWPAWSSMPLMFLVWVAAISRLANLGNDVFHGWCRTVRHNKHPFPLEEPDD